MKNYSSDLFSSWKIKNEEIENKSSALNMKKEDEIKEIDENFNSNFSLDDTEIINNDSIDQIDYSKSSLKIENISKISRYLISRQSKYFKNKSRKINFISWKK